ncbi:RluA family pseudouridine synthase [Bdellovibrionota bacterium FG-1]
MLKKYTLKTTLDQRNQRLDHVLAEWLPVALGQPVSKGKVRKLIVAGAVYLNGRRVRIASKPLMPNAKIDVQIDLKKLFEDDGRAQDRPFEMTQSDVLFEDEFIIVVNKPPGLPTQPTLDEARVNLFSSVKKFLAARSGVVDPYLALHHRLDRDTSGVILLVKSKAANSGASEMFSKHLARKTYQALSWIEPGVQVRDQWVEQNYLGRLSTPGKQSQFGAVRSGGDPAETHFRVIEKLGNRALWVEAKPITGRTHQIRVHLSEVGLPIVADSLYGHRRPREKTRMMLHAVSLTFPHPIHQTEVSVSCPLPEDFLQCVGDLRQIRS